MKDMQRILNYLRKNAFREINVATVSKALKINRETTKQYLNRLHKKGLIDKPIYGFYKAYADVDVIRANQFTNPPSLLHGIVLQFEFQRVTKWGQGAPAKRKSDNFSKEDKSARVTISPRKIDINKKQAFFDGNGYFYLKENNAHITYKWWEMTKLTFSVYDDKAMVHINSSKNPLNYLDFREVLSFIKGHLSELGPFTKELVREVGLSKDFKELRLEGAKSVSLRAYMNAWTRIYYKDDIGATRVEHHLDMIMPIDDALKSLSILTEPVNWKRETGEIDDAYA